MEAISAAYDSNIPMIDGTSIRAHQQPATLKRGSRSLSRSLARRAHDQDLRGRRPAWLARQARSDGGAGERCTSRADPLDRLEPRTIVLADKAYDAGSIRDLIEGQGAVPNIPAKFNRK